MTIAIPGITTDRWADDHSLSAGDAKRGRAGSKIEAAKDIAHRITANG